MVFKTRTIPHFSMKLEMQIKFTGCIQPLSSESFNSLFTKQRIQEKSVLYTTVIVPINVQGGKTWSLTLRENRIEFKIGC